MSVMENVIRELKDEDERRKEENERLRSSRDEFVAHLKSLMENIREQKNRNNEIVLEFDQFRHSTQSEIQSLEKLNGKLENELKHNFKVTFDLTNFLN